MWMRGLMKGKCASDDSDIVLGGKQYSPFGFLADYNLIWSIQWVERPYVVVQSLPLCTLASAKSGFNRRGCVVVHGDFDGQDESIDLSKEDLVAYTY